MENDLQDTVEENSPMLPFDKLPPTRASELFRQPYFNLAVRLNQGPRQNYPTHFPASQIRGNENVFLGL